MIMKHLKYFIVYLLIGLLAGCSYNDLTDLWPSGNDVEEEILIREIPDESFDPEDTEEITITEIEDPDEITEIDILSDEADITDSNEENIDNLLAQDETDISEDNIQTKNNGKVEGGKPRTIQQAMKIRKKQREASPEHTEGLRQRSYIRRACGAGCSRRCGRGCSRRMEQRRSSRRRRRRKGEKQTDKIREPLTEFWE